VISVNTHINLNVDELVHALPEGLLERCVAIKAGVYQRFELLIKIEQLSHKFYILWK
jgi:hypothetical protein